MNSTAPRLHWLPEPPDWRPSLAALTAAGDDAWDRAVALAGTRLDFVRTNALDLTIRTRFADAAPATPSTRPVRLAILGSATLVHLHSAIRVGAARRGVWVETYEGAYGQHVQEMLDPGSALHAFRPDHILFAFDARRIVAGAKEGDGHSAAASTLREAWRLAKQTFGCSVLQQTVLPVFPSVLGENEHRLSDSRAGLVRRLNASLRTMSDEEGVDLVALDTRAAQDGLDAWYDPALWHRAKQEVKPAAAPMYGELVARLLAAKRGRSRKALVLDLDNTLWGGVIGDDGVEGVALGEGSALGEAFLEVQRYALELSKRGVILAVCSKNDPKNAIEAFERHPEIILKLSDFGAFVCNWRPKPDNLRMIAETLNIGLDALVFLDDNPFERTHVRTELPMVAVPEVSDEPATYPQAIADAGYFEAIELSEEDRARTAQYQSNLARESLRAEATNIDDYLKSLEMRMLWSRIDVANLRRPTQLINKTNQFNLTTRRRTEEEMTSFVQANSTLGVQLRLTDRFGDNGVIAVVLGAMNGGDLHLDTWLMSCRVLGRRAEAATLNVVAAQAAALGAKRLVGEFRPTAKNAMVEDHYPKLGFASVSEIRVDDDRLAGQPAAADTSARDDGFYYVLDLDTFKTIETSIEITEEPER